MKRGLLTLFVLMLICFVTSVVAQRSDPSAQNVPQPSDCTAATAKCPPTPTAVPHPQPTPTANAHNQGTHPGDKDGGCPNQSSPASNHGCPVGVSPTSVPTAMAVQSSLPTTGNCVLATLSDEAVNVHSQPMLNAQIVSTLDPTTPSLVLGIVDNSEGDWYRIVPGWVAESAVRLGGDCTALPVIDEPGAAGVDPIKLSYPNGFALTLDKGKGGGKATAQSDCAPTIAIDWPDGSSKDALHFNFGSSSWCFKLNGDRHGFGLTPPGQCDQTSGTSDCAQTVTNWYVGFSGNPAIPILIAVIQPDPSEPGVLFSWKLNPSGTCKSNKDCSTQGGGENFALNWRQQNVNGNQPGLTIGWGLQNANGSQPGLTIGWGLQNLGNPGQQNLGGVGQQNLGGVGGVGQQNLGGVGGVGGQISGGGGGVGQQNLGGVGGVGGQLSGGVGGVGQQNLGGVGGVGQQNLGGVGGVGGVGGQISGGVGGVGGVGGQISGGVGGVGGQLSGGVGGQISGGGGGVGQQNLGGVGGQISGGVGGVGQQNLGGVGGVGGVGGQISGGVGGVGQQNLSGVGLTINLGLQNANENQPGLTISWVLQNANENQPNGSAQWSQEIGGLNQLSVPIIDSPAPNSASQSIGISGVPGVSAQIAIMLPAVQ